MGDIKPKQSSVWILRTRQSVVTEDCYVGYGLSLEGEGETEKHTTGLKR